MEFEGGDVELRHLRVVEAELHRLPEAAAEPAGLLRAAGVQVDHV